MIYLPHWQTHQHHFQVHHHPLSSIISNIHHHHYRSTPLLLPFTIAIDLISSIGQYHRRRGQVCSLCSRTYSGTWMLLWVWFDTLSWCKNPSPWSGAGFIVFKTLFIRPPRPPHQRTFIWCVFPKVSEYYLELDQMHFTDVISDLINAAS